MGIVAENPPWIEVARAQETMQAELAKSEPARLATLLIISKGVKYQGTIKEQEKLQLTYSEIRGEMQRAILGGQDAVKKALPKIVQALDNRILNHADYQKFKITVAETPDPLLVP